MEIIKSVTLTIEAIIAFAISITVIQLFIRKEKLKSESDGKICLAYGILFSSWILSYAILNFKTLSILSEICDTVFKLNSINPLSDIVKASTFLLGWTNIWLIFLYLIMKTISILFVNKRNDDKEIENNNYVYFILKGSGFIGIVYTLLPVFENILRLFYPNIDIPYYR